MRSTWGVVKLKPTIYCGDFLGRTQYIEHWVTGSRYKIIPLDAIDQPLPEARQPVGSARIGALLEILLCSGVPSQLALAYMFALAGFTPFVQGQLSFAYITTLLLVDASLLIALIFWLLRRSGERPRDVFLGGQPVGPEIRLGVALTPVIFALAITVLSATRLILPSLHNVEENPLQQLIQTPAQALVLVVVATIGGGLREEIQRAFILHRFEHHLGGARVGLVLYSLVFGLGHALQGWDAVLTTTILGACWGYVYIARRSILASVVSHSGFNAAEIVVFVIGRT